MPAQAQSPLFVKLYQLLAAIIDLTYHARYGWHIHRFQPPEVPRTAGGEHTTKMRIAELLMWLLQHTARFPKSKRFRLARRVEDNAFRVW